MNTKSQVKTYVILIALIYIASILMVIPATNGAGMNDGSEVRASARVQPDIYKVGNKPVANDQVTISGLEDEEISVLVYATDPDTAQLLFSDDSNLFDIKIEGTQGDDTIGNITFTPKNKDVGKLNVSISVIESGGGGGMDQIRIIFDITNTNDPPTMEEIENIDVNQDEWVIVNINATDDDGLHIVGDVETLTFNNNIVTAVPGIDEDVNYYFSTSHSAGFKLWTAKFQFKPDHTMIGKYQVKFTLKDSGDEKEEQTINLTVINVNDPPDTPEIINPTISLIDSNSEIIFKGRAKDLDLELENSDEELNFTWTTFYNSETTTLGYGDEFKTSDMAIGNHTVTLSVRDKAGANSSTSIDLRIRSLFQLTAPDAAKSFTDEKLDLLQFKSSDGVRFESGFSQNFPWVDIVSIESKLDGIDLVVTMTMQGNIRNASGNNYYVYIVNSAHEETPIDLGSDSLPVFYTPGNSFIYHTFTFEGGKGFAPKAGKDESYRIYDDNKIEFKIRVTYLEFIGKMPRDFGVFAISRYSSEAGSLGGDYAYTYDALGSGNVKATEPLPFEDVGDSDSILDEPLMLAIIVVIIIIFLAIVVIILMKRRKDRKDLIAPPSYDYKFVSGFQDQAQYESLYGTSKPQTQVATQPMMPGMPPMQPGMQPGMPPMQPGMPGALPGQIPPPGRPGAIPPAGGGKGSTCPKCGKAIVLGMTKCPYCQQAL